MRLKTVTNNYFIRPVGSRINRYLIKPFGYSIVSTRTMPYVGRRSIRRARKLQEKLASQNQPIQLELGTSKPRTNWITVDLQEGADLIFDLIRPLPFPDSAVDKIYSSHLLEHFHYPDIIALLNECYRVLKNGGSFSVCVPDAAIYVNAYCSREEFDAKTFCVYEPAFHYYSKIDLVNYIAHMGGHHKHMWDRENLVGVLRSIGFQRVTLRDFDPELDLKERAYESIYALAIK